jgi:3-oxoacyl-[acyl-carrier-protein] synthase-3
MKNAKIIGTGSCTPELVLTNKDLERIVDTSDEWIIKRTGIKERRIAKEGQYSSDMASEAAREALAMAGIKPDDLDMIVVGTVTPDRQFPSCACLVQHKIGAMNAASMDVSAGCSGFVYALSVAHNAIRCGSAKYVLAVGAEVLSSVTNWEDRGTCVLLGDGAGAVVLGPSEGSEGIRSINLKSDGGFGDLLYSVDDKVTRPGLNLVERHNHTKPFYLVMEGNRLFKKAVQCLEEVALATLAEADVSVEELSLVVPHQANLRIINALAQRLGLPEEKVYVTVHKYGNTSSASIPIALHEANTKGMLKTRDKLLMVTFGAGLTWGGSLVEWFI